jgi:uncharacterized protein (DUF1697 family)
MEIDVAFLRGINLGKRQMKMAALKACLERAGFEAVKTVLASGNVRFARRGEAAATRKALEKAIADEFGFEVGVVLRTDSDIRAMLALDPFARLDPKADVVRHVLLLDTPLPDDTKIEDIPGHTEIVRIDPREIYIAGYRQPDGRYTEGIEGVLKPLRARLGKTVLDTMRNWNTIEKVLS